MTEPSLLEHLIKDFQEQKEILHKQIESVDPLAASIRQPIATRLFHSGFLIMLEIFAWILVVATIAFVLFMDKLAPFYYLNQIAHDTQIIDTYKQKDLINLIWGVKGIALLNGFLFFWIARMLAKIRLKNSILNIAGKTLKELVEQFFKRRATMESLENKFPLDLPKDADSIIMNTPTNHNDILL